MNKEGDPGGVLGGPATFKSFIRTLEYKERTILSLQLGK